MDVCFLLTFRLARELQHDRSLPGEWALQDQERQQWCDPQPQFVERGLQHVRLTRSYTPNNYSLFRGRLYIDQPVGVGFSHGTTTVGTSQEAASDIWKFLQIFFADSRFSKYQKNNFALWTES